MTRLHVDPPPGPRHCCWRPSLTVPVMNQPQRGRGQPEILWRGCATIRRCRPPTLTSLRPYLPRSLPPQTVSLKPHSSQPAKRIPAGLTCQQSIKEVSFSPSTPNLVSEVSLLPLPPSPSGARSLLLRRRRPRSRVSNTLSPRRYSLSALAQNCGP